MNWSNFKKKVKPNIETIYNKGLDTETLILSNGFGIAKYEGVEKRKRILKRLNNASN